MSNEKQEPKTWKELESDFRKYRQSLDGVETISAYTYYLQNIAKLTPPSIEQPRREFSIEEVEQIIADCWNAARIRNSAGALDPVVYPQENTPFKYSWSFNWSREYLTSRFPELTSDGGLLQAPKESQEELKIEANTLGGCDHSVGICQCDLNDLIARNQILIAHREGSAPQEPKQK